MLVKSFMKKSIVIMATFVTGTLLAQPAPNPPAPTPASDDAQPEGPQLTTEQMTIRANELARESENDHRLVVGLQIKARREKDVIKLTCINEKLLQIKALRNMIESVLGVFITAPARDSFDQLSSHASEVRVLREAAQACAGEIELFTDSANNYTAPDIPDDPTDPLFPGGVEPPGYASPYN